LLVQARLYAIPASNAVLTAQLALERKRIPFRRIDQTPVLHRILMRIRGFKGSTVPGLVIEGRKVHGSRAILEALDAVKPEPRLFPEDPAARAEVGNALAWGEDVYQRSVRTLLPYSLLRSSWQTIATILEDSLLITPTSVMARTGKPAVFINSLLNGSNEDSVCRCLSELPAMLDLVDELIAKGVLNADEPGAADVMIAPTTRAFMWWEQLRPLVDGRPAAEHARRVAPRFPGDIPAVLPL
jgi:glutathione S-transferase